MGERKMYRRFLIFAFILFTVTVASAESPFWGNLKNGPHTVGFQIIEKFDHGRPFKRKLDYEGKLTTGDRSRPIQINVWYPAKAGKGAAMVLRDYIHLTATEDLVPLTQTGKEQSETQFVKSRWFAGAPENQVKALLDQPVAAIRDAAHADGKYPLVIIALSSSLSSPYGQFVLAENLASNGYIVASIPSRGAQSTVLGSREATVDRKSTRLNS